METPVAEVMLCLIGAFLVGKYLGWEQEPDEYYDLSKYDDDDGCK